MSDSVEVNDLFNGLTRPLTIMGVTMEYVLFCGMVVLSLFIMAESIKWLLVYIPLHLMGWVGCKYDAHIFSVINKKLDVSASPNKKIWGGSSYESY
jgi:type IV secretion system protein VirB3